MEELRRDPLKDIVEVSKFWLTEGTLGCKSGGKELESIIIVLLGSLLVKNHSI